MVDLKPPLPQGAGYAIVVGLGFVFAAGMIMTTYVLKRYNKEIITAEEFSTAGRNVKTGLISAAVVSSWTWAATLLTSTTQAYKHGIFGSISYAAGASVQIVLFACIAIVSKYRAPQTHSYTEIIKARYGTFTHCVFIFYGIATNILVTAMLLTGGSAVVNSLTGMNTIAACLLLPLGVMLYTLFGGLKATFLTDYIHTVVIIVIIFVFSFSTFATNHLLGSPGAVYDKVMAAGKLEPISGNAEGSYMTMKSRSAGIFFVINIVGNFGTVFLDNGYFNKAFASSPAAALPGYVLGGLAWYAIPAFTSLTMGFAAIALQDTPAWPTYPNRLTADQITAGLVLPNASVALLGKGGAVCSLLLIFMAVTSAMSAELIAVSTIFTYDIYRPYINPKANGKTLIMTSHISVIVFAYAMAGFAIGLYYAGISMGYLYELMGIIISGAVLPSVMTLFSRKQNWVAASVSPILATIFAILAWLVSAWKQFGVVNVDTTFEDIPMLTGNVVALLSPLIFIPIFTLIFKPQNFDWEILKTKITRVDETEEILEATRSSADIEDQNDEKLTPIKSQVLSAAHEIAAQNEQKAQDEENYLRRAAKIGGIICGFLTFALILMWPMPMYGQGYVFSKNFFTGWVVIFFIWIFFTAFVVGVYPVYEGRKEIYHTLRGVYWDLTGQGAKVKQWQDANPEDLHVVRSQVSAEIAQMQTAHENNIDDELDSSSKS